MEKFLKTNLLSKRIALSMKTRKGWIDIANRCVELNIPTLALTAYKQADKIDAKLVRMLKPRLTGETLGEITDADIESANNHPIENLFPEHKKGKVLCIFHSEKNPSATIGRNNRFKCFSCGKSASVIDCYMKLHGKTFIESVKELR